MSSRRGVGVHRAVSFRVDQAWVHCIEDGSTGYPLFHDRRVRSCTPPRTAAKNEMPVD